MDNWRFLFYWQRSLGVVCMGEQLKSDSLPLPLSLSSRVVIELPAGVRPTGGLRSRQSGSVSYAALRRGGHSVPIKTRQAQSFSCNIFTNPTLHHFSFCCWRREKLMHYKQVLRGKTVTVGADAPVRHFTASGGCWGCCCQNDWLICCQ